jgi:hypothetical protein
MRRSLLVVMIATALVARPHGAAADPAGLGGLGEGLLYLTAVALGYVIETAAFAYADTGDPHHGFGVGAFEAGVNLPIASVFVDISVIGFAEHNPVAGVFAGGAAALNGWLAYNGMRSVGDHWPYPVASWQLGLVALDSLQLVGFTAYDLVSKYDHDPIGIVQAAINIPAAGALALLSAHEVIESHTAPAGILGIGAVLSGISGYAGIRMAIRHSDPKAALLVPGPILIGDARGQPALGFGVSGSL